jgi:ABC-type phosphate/phosphonate transport system substrate-binding protein
MSKPKLVLAVAVVALLGGGTAYYLGATPKRTLDQPAPAVAAAETLIFTSPPRETPEEGELTYKPLVDYLSQVTGKKIVYKHPGTWGVYRTEMLAGNYDIVFDGPHFVDYRVQRLGHTTLAKLAEIHEFVIIARKDDKANAVADLAGKTFCTQSPPNLGALIALSQFKDGAQQPVLVPTKGWAGIQEGVATGRCTGGIMPLANLKKLDKDDVMKVLFKSQPMVNQGFTASARVTPEDRARIAAALTAPEAAAPTEKLRTRFNAGERLVAANNAEYEGISEVLRAEWGFF